MRKLRADALALAALTAVAAGSASGAGCSTTKPTELVPGVSSQVVVPHDLQAVRLTVTANGRTVFDQGYNVGAAGEVQLPSTLGVVAAEAPSTIVTITVRGYETPCEMSDDCTQLGNAPVGDTGSRILRRSTQTFVDQHTLFVPMPLTYSCWNTDCGDVGMACKGNTCVHGGDRARARSSTSTRRSSTAPTCASAPAPASATSPTGGPSLADRATSRRCRAPAPTRSRRRRPWGSTCGPTTRTSPGPREPAVSTSRCSRPAASRRSSTRTRSRASRWISAADAGVGDGGSASQSLFRLAPGLCELVHAATNPPPPPATGTSTYITLSDLRVANLCPPKTPLLPICAGEQSNGPALPTGEITTDGTCNVGVPLAPTQSALYLLMDHSTVMHGAFGPMGSATALSLSLSDPVFKRTFAAFTFLLRAASPTARPRSTAFTMPDIDFGLAAHGADEDRRRSSTAGRRPTRPRRPRRSIFRRRCSSTRARTRTCRLPRWQGGPEHRGGDVLREPRPPTPRTTATRRSTDSPRCRARSRARSSRPYNATPERADVLRRAGRRRARQSAPTGALTFFKKVQADLPQAVQVLDATQDQRHAGGADRGGELLEARDPARHVPLRLRAAAGDRSGEGRDRVHDPRQDGADASSRLAPGCTAATQTTTSGWNIDNGRLRICGAACTNLRTGSSGRPAAALQSGQPAAGHPRDGDHPLLGHRAHERRGANLVGGRARRAAAGATRRGAPAAPRAAEE